MVKIVTALEASTVLIACIVLAFSTAWICYLVFFPLVKTIAGKVQILRIHGMRGATRPGRDRALDPFVSDLEVGPTMADGGEKAVKEEAWTRRRSKKQH
jgi:hypothetical protein